MKKPLLFIVFILLFQNIATAQFGESCLPNGITFTTQTEIDDFQTNYPNCAMIEGDVKISGDNITSLIGLNILSSVGGDLKISSSSVLTSLSGLEGITSVGGGLSIYNNDSLTSLSALSNMSSIGGDLTIFDTPLTSLTGLDNLSFVSGNLHIIETTLTSLTGLNNLTSVGGNFLIVRNYFIPNLSGLESLSIIDGDFHIGIPGAIGSGNSLTSLSGLNNLVTIGGDFSIIQNGSLTSLLVLDNLTTIGGDLTIGISSLTSLTGLDNVTSIGGKLGITNNDSLTSLSGLDNISAGSISELYIVNNPSLSACEVFSVCSFLTNPGGEIFIEGNATGCNDRYEVEASCLVSVQEDHFSEKNWFYPNPSSSLITIELPDFPQKNTLLCIQNINGQQVHKQPITDLNTLVDVSHLPNGFYFIKVSDDKNALIGNMVKK